MCEVKATLDRIKGEFDTAQEEISKHENRATEPNMKSTKQGLK